MIDINGTTELAGVIGWPLDHTLSPVMHNAVYEHLGLNWIYIPLAVEDDVGVERVMEAARSLPFVGFNITMPYKQTALSLCDEVAEAALIAGAVNTVHCVDGRLIGYNTDGRGFIETLLEEAEVDARGTRVALLGAGGAAAGVFVSLILAGADRVSVVNRSVERAEELIERVTSHVRDIDAAAVPWAESEDAVREADLVVNCTSLGMDPNDPSPVPEGWLRPEHVVFDMVYRADATPLVREARAAGARALDGLGMLVRQGANAVDIWHESAQVRTPRDVMRAAAEVELAARALRMQG